MKPLYLLVGLYIWLSAPAVFALCPVTSEVDDIADLDPVSLHYIGPVLERIEAGLNKVNSASSSSFGPVGKFIWSLYAQSTINSSTNIVVDRTIALRSLKEQTSCLRIDTKILESKLEQLRCALDEALTEQNGLKMFYLRGLIQFTQESIAQLHRGALDPFYSDTNFGKLRHFDDTSTITCLERNNAACKNCCKTNSTVAACAVHDGLMYYKIYGLQRCLADGGVLPTGTADPGPGICPFTSDYLPPTSLGYGCDIEVLNPVLSALPALEPFKSEYDGLEQLVEKRNDFIRESEQIGELRKKIDRFTGKQEPDLDNFGSSLTRTHETISNCLQPTKFTGDAPEDFTLHFNPLYSSGATFTEARGPFSFGYNETKLSRLLIEKVMNREIARALPPYVQTPYQTSGTGSTASTALNMLTSLAKNAYNSLFVPLIREQSGNQAISKAATLGYTQDMLMQITEAYAPLRESIGGLSRSAGTKDEGIRHFGLNFAWYLRRSCLERPCTKTLDRVLKILLADECFPYTDGSFKDEDAFAKCKDAAGL